jgi:hypothetical protein
MSFHLASTVHDFRNIKKQNKPTKFRFVRMVVVDNLKGQTVGEKVSENIIYDTVVKTDNYKSYSKIKVLSFLEDPEGSWQKNNERPWGKPARYQKS